MIKNHNLNVDVFTDKFNEQNQLINELKKLEQFKQPIEQRENQKKTEAKSLKSFLFFNFESLSEDEKSILTDYERQTTDMFED